MPSNIIPVLVAGNATIHAGRKIGTYQSGSDRFRKLCAASSRTERYEPIAIPGQEITCKRCLAKLASR